MAGRGNAGNAGRGVLKQAIKDLETRVTNTEQRLDRVETTVELSEGYRRLRVEHSAKLDELWNKFLNKEVEGRDMRNLATTALQQEIKEVLSKEVPENELQEKNNSLSNGRRALPPQRSVRPWPANLAWVALWSGSLRTVQVGIKSSYSVASPAASSQSRSEAKLTGCYMYSQRWQSPRPGYRYIWTAVQNKEQRDREKQDKAKAAKARARPKEKQRVKVARGAERQTRTTWKPKARGCVLLAPQQPKKKKHTQVLSSFCFVRSVPGYLQRYCGQNEVRPQAARCSPATCGAARLASGIH